MNNHSLLGKFALVAFAGWLQLTLRPSFVRAQSSVAEDWEKAAGGKMSFDVASVRLNNGPMEPSNFPLDADDAYGNTGGLLSADNTLSTYVLFAYKIFPTREQFQSLFGKLPPWVLTDNYEVQARAELQNPTKDQMRLMVQSVLKERFGLVVHYETQDNPVLVMSFVKQGKLGPELHRHEDGPACSITGRAAEAAPMEMKGTDIFPAECGRVEAVPTKNQTLLMEGRNVTLEMMAKSFQAGHLGRPIVVGTGLSGNYDFTLNWTPEPGAFGTERETGPQDASISAPEGPTFLEALKDQMGLELREGKVTQRVLAIDHIERPSEN